MMFECDIMLSSKMWATGRMRRREALSSLILIETKSSDIYGRAEDSTSVYSMAGNFKAVTKEDRIRRAVCHYETLNDVDGAFRSEDQSNLGKYALGSDPDHNRWSGKQPNGGLDA